MFSQTQEPRAVARVSPMRHVYCHNRLRRQGNRSMCATSTTKGGVCVREGNRVRTNKLKASNRVRRPCGSQSIEGGVGVGVGAARVKPP